MESELRKHWGKNIENHSRKVGTPHLKVTRGLPIQIGQFHISMFRQETILAWAKKIKAEDDDRFKYTYLALGLLLFDHVSPQLTCQLSNMLMLFHPQLKRQFVIESDFPLDDQGRPSKTKTIKAWWDEWMPVVCRQWVANNKHDGKSVRHLTSLLQSTRTYTSCLVHPSHGPSDRSPQEEVHLLERGRGEGGEEDLQGRATRQLRVHEGCQGNHDGSSGRGTAVYPPKYKTFSKYSIYRCRPGWTRGTSSPQATRGRNRRRRKNLQSTRRKKKKENYSHVVQTRITRSSPYKIPHF